MPEAVLRVQLALRCERHRLNAGGVSRDDRSLLRGEFLTGYPLRLLRRPASDEKEQSQGLHALLVSATLKRIPSRTMMIGPPGQRHPSGLMTGPREKTTVRMRFFWTASSPKCDKRTTSQ